MTAQKLAMIKNYNSFSEIGDTLKNISVLKHKIDLPARIKVIRKHVSRGDYKYLNMQLKAISKYSENIYRDIEFLKHVAWSAQLDKKSAF